MEKEIETLIKVSTLRDVEIKIKEAQIRGKVVPDIVISILRDLEKSYGHEKSI